MSEPRDTFLQVCGMRPAHFTGKESWGVWLQAVPCLAPEPKNSPCSVSLSSKDVACGDRQWKGKLAFSWHVNFCSLGTKGGPSAHCVSHEVGAFVHKKPVLDFSPPLNVEIWQALQVVSWGHPLWPPVLGQPTLWAKKAMILISWHFSGRNTCLSCIFWLTEADSWATHVDFLFQGCLGTPGSVHVVTLQWGFSKQYWTRSRRNSLKIYGENAKQKNWLHMAL